MATKFVRGLLSSVTAQRSSNILKWVYEFWGYCINGTASLTTPGGLATTTPTSGSANFFEGTSVLATGSDGYTNATTIFRYDGYTHFYTASTSPFTVSMVGKQLVMWKPNSGSSEDSVYNIIGYVSPNDIVININTGGIPSAPDGYKPSVTSRSSINYRIVDIITAQASGADTNYVVFQLDPTGINVGQANSQIQIITAGGNLRWDFKLSPGGTWNGSAFTDATGLVTGATFFNGGGGGNISVNLIGDKDFLIIQSKDATSTSQGYYFHWEIPERLYSQALDPNPIVAVIGGYSSTTAFTTDSTIAGYGGGWTMKCNDGTARNYKALTKATTGDGSQAANIATYGGSLAYIFGRSLTDIRLILNAPLGIILSSQAVLCLPGVAGQYSLARVRLRRIRFTNGLLPLFSRFDSNGDFIQMTQAVALPWDKTVLPFTLFPY